MKAASSNNLPNEQVGAINKAFKYLYQIRLIGKSLKAYNKTIYYLVKYFIFIGLLALIFVK